jgi:hypothetical protein
MNAVMCSSPLSCTNSTYLSPSGFRLEHNQKLLIPGISSLNADQHYTYGQSHKVDLYMSVSGPMLVLEGIDWRVYRSLSDHTALADVLMHSQGKRSGHTIFLPDEGGRQDQHTHPRDLQQHDTFDAACEHSPPRTSDISLRRPAWK